MLSPVGCGLDLAEDPFRFKQRKRELQCAVLLAAKLDDFAVDGDEDVFLEKATRKHRNRKKSRLLWGVGESKTE